MAGLGVRVVRAPTPDAFPATTSLPDGSITTGVSGTR